MKQCVTVMVIDDQPIFRNAVVGLLCGETGITIVGEFGSTGEATRIAQERRPDVIMMALNQPQHAFAQLDGLVGACPMSNILVIHASEDHETISGVISRGARGYLHRAVTGPELIRTVRAVGQGEIYVPPALAGRALEKSSRLAAEARAGDLEELTPPELQIIALIAQGLTDKDIALRLHLKEKTVRSYLTSAYKKMNVRTRFEAATLAARRAGLVLAALFALCLPLPGGSEAVIEIEDDPDHTFHQSVPGRLRLAL
jgi:two-component system nitrate/nitrite response regulator NarL